MSLSVGKTSEEGAVFGRRDFSFGNRSARMRVRISSHGKNSHAAAPIRPKTQLPLAK
jgi:hypothetical protein